MTEASEPQKKTPVPPVPEKKPFVGLPPRTFGNPNPSFNKFGGKGKGGGGPQAIRKHAARSR